MTAREMKAFLAIVLVGVLIVCSSAGCSTEAQIRLRGGDTLENVIVRSDADSIYVLSEVKSGYSWKPRLSEKKISRGDIVDIRHPGLGMAITWTIAGSLGLITTVLGFAIDPCGSEGNSELGNDCNSGSLYPLSILGGLVTLASSPMAIWGWWVWSDSVAAADRPDEDDIALGITPLAFTDGEQVYYGVGMGWTW